ncbi:protein of unknown function [Actinopolyspora lacussalsi subsp. righensis]|uniref:DUF397 domain-containing protein n=1 Tax=Actinopolyspora righensis TaxID=995060 RepID=A0A1I6Y012_9ACTN|nr:DUF397 domain-containing protein [Actinopolyspora righensis]SFT43900.1 protein of unknown function [Actinopolyspora righensis]
MNASHEPHDWRKSSYSANTSTCVEVGRTTDGAAVRDSKDRTAGHITTTHHQWRTFLQALKADHFG